jgi:hypothetical protein
MNIHGVLSTIVSTTHPRIHNLRFQRFRVGCRCSTRRGDTFPHEWSSPSLAIMSVASREDEVRVSHVNAIRFMSAVVTPSRPEIEHRPAARSMPYLTSASSTAGPQEVTSDVTSQSPYIPAANTAHAKN